jgi:hypothetical protein
VDEQTKTQRLKYYARIYVVRGGMEGSWRLPTDKRVNLHLGTNPLAGAQPAQGPDAVSREDYLIAEKIVNLDNNLLVKGLSSVPVSSASVLKYVAFSSILFISTRLIAHLVSSRSLNTFDKMRLEVEYVRALQYQPAGQPARSSSFLSASMADDASILSGNTRGGSTIFSDFQKRVNLTGDVVYRLRVRLTNDDGLTGGPAAQLDQSASWDLDIPLDLSLFVKMSGGQCYVGTVSSGLYFPPASPVHVGPDGKPTSAAFLSTIDQLSPSKQPTDPSTSSSSSSFMDHSFYLRLFSLSFHNRTSVQSFPFCSAFTATRYPATQGRLEREISQMKLWMNLKLQYSFNLLLKVIFDTDSIRNYERMFSLIMKIRLVARLLEKLWMTRSRLITTDRLFCNLRHSMHFFISNLLYYLQVDVVDSGYSDLLREIYSLRGMQKVHQNPAAQQPGHGHGHGHHQDPHLSGLAHQNDFQTILRIHKKFLANILKLSMIDHLGIQESIDRILFICLRFIACVRIQSDHEAETSNKSASEPPATDSFVFIPVEEYEHIQREFFLQISFLFQSMKTLDSRGFLFRLDFNNYLSNQIMELFHSQHPPAAQKG